MFSCSGSGVRTAPAHCFLLGSPPGSRLSSELSLARRRLGLRVTRWFLRALHALASFLLAQGIALSERKSSPSRVEPPGKCSSLPCAPDGGGGGPETKGHGQESRRDPDLRAEAGEVRFITEGLGDPETHQGAAPVHRGAAGDLYLRGPCGEARVSLQRSWVREGGGSTQGSRQEARFPFCSWGRSCHCCPGTEGGRKHRRRPGLREWGCGDFAPRSPSAAHPGDPRPSGTWDMGRSSDPSVAPITATRAGGIPGRAPWGPRRAWVRAPGAPPRPLLLPEPGAGSRRLSTGRGVQGAPGRPLPGAGGWGG